LNEEDGYGGARGLENAECFKGALEEGAIRVQRVSSQGILGKGVVPERGIGSY
jgi:hypothetical protein